MRCRRIWRQIYAETIGVKRARELITSRDEEVPLE
jgi:hypothetical protein